MNVLYLSYDGMLEPLGQSQVIQYLLRLAPAHSIALISFEKPHDLADAARMAETRRGLAEAGIEWHPMRYHRRFSLASTLYDVVRGFTAAARIVRRRHVQVVHARSYVMGLLGLMLKAATGTRLLFDMRGFWPDERVDGGSLQAQSLLYRLLKRLEKQLLVSADAVVSLTHAGVAALRQQSYVQEAGVDFEVIPTCTNLSLFTPSEIPPPEPPLVFGYVGSVASYYRFDRVLDTFEVIRSRYPSAQLVVVNKGQHDLIAPMLAARPLLSGCTELRELPFREVAQAMRSFHAALFFIVPSYAKQASSPTRLGELLACGVPCLVNSGVGDIGPLVHDRGVGVVVDLEASEDELERAVHRLVEMARSPDVRQRCVDVAHEVYGLEQGVAAYHRLYLRLGTERHGK